MDFQTLFSIRNKAWLIEPESAFQWHSIFESLISGNGSEALIKSFQDGPKGYEGKFLAIESIVKAPKSSYRMEEFTGFGDARIAVIPISGPLMKADYCGTYGTSTLIQLTKMANENRSVEAIIYDFDSPGGTVDGTQLFAQAIQNSPKKTIAIVGGMCCSAAYWLASSCNEVYASSDTDVIGSIGTMISLTDDSKAKEKAGFKVNTYFATASKDKNLAYLKAKEGDGTLLIDEMLDPMNAIFLAQVKQNRPNVSENALTGKTFIGSNAQQVGLTDGVKSYDEIVSTILSEPRKPAYSKYFQTKNVMADVKLTLAEIKAQYPEHVSAIQAEGASAERTRVAAWMKFNEVDPRSVIEGIAGGKEIVMEQVIDFMQKANGQSAVKGLSGRNAADIKTGASTGQTEGEMTMLDVAHKFGWGNKFENVMKSFAQSPHK